jgi:hypothetical protein
MTRANAATCAGELSGNSRASLAVLVELSQRKEEPNLSRAFSLKI